MVESLYRLVFFPGALTVRNLIPYIIWGVSECRKRVEVCPSKTLLHSRQYNTQIYSFADGWVYPRTLTLDPRPVIVSAKNIGITLIPAVIAP